MQEMSSVTTAPSSISFQRLFSRFIVLSSCFVLVGLKVVWGFLSAFNCIMTGPRVLLQEGKNFFRIFLPRPFAFFPPMRYDGTSSREEAFL